MAKLITQCPSCDNGNIRINSVSCTNCSVKFEGNFKIPALLQLSEEELLFIQEFVKSSGSLKEIAKKFSISYPTVRNRLNSVIKSLNKLDNDASTTRTKVLADFELGKIDFAEATELLKTV